ncbi:leucine-rich repeat extensin-like protein 4 [Nymphaea colorata]|uniref:leucine-rich repeat extensin-like protein 4 n=1 Tax=Nymphaea colorata TaxID=210225 RepID=UPI00129E46D4|nr:leucine-rich repeat extensin-like protein 4 [Nymphaea colorata]
MAPKLTFLLFCSFISCWSISSAWFFLNPRLLNAYIALQVWKLSIHSDPNNVTGTWVGYDVCRYTGVFCAKALDDNSTTVVAGIDLNHFDICGYLPEKLGLLSDLALFHINSNRFYGFVPISFTNLRLLYELDLSNNRFYGYFPSVVLCLPSLKFLDIRFNAFEGRIPPALFEMNLDVLFINDNNFVSTIPENFGNSTVSVVVFANNNIRGCLPKSIGRMGSTLSELLLLNNSLTSCIPEEIGNLTELVVLDIGYNEFVGPLPDSLGALNKLEQLNVAHNKLSGEIPATICHLPALQNFTYSYNFFVREPPACLNLPKQAALIVSDAQNCILDRPEQRPKEECLSFLRQPVDCANFSCFPPPPPALPPPPRPPPQLSFSTIGVDPNLRGHRIRGPHWP